MNKTEKKSLDIEVSKMEVDVDKRIIQGYFSIFDSVDQGRDVVKRGAFSKTIKERGPKEINGKPTSQIKMAYNHKTVIGIPVLLHEDSTGGYFEGKVANIPIGNDVLTLVKEGAVDGCSFEYIAIKANYPREDKHVDREITEAKLFETGPVDYPMHEGAGIVGVKNRLDSIAEMCDELLYLICKKNSDIKDISELKALYDELTARLQVAEEETLPEINSQPNGDLVLERLKAFQLKLEKY